MSGRPENCVTFFLPKGVTRTVSRDPIKIFEFENDSMRLKGDTLGVFRPDSLKIDRPVDKDMEC